MLNTKTSQIDDIPLLYEDEEDEMGDTYRPRPRFEPASVAPGRHSLRDSLRKQSGHKDRQILLSPIASCQYERHNLTMRISQSTLNPHSYTWRLSC